MALSDEASRISRNKLTTACYEVKRGLKAFISAVPSSQKLSWLTQRSIFAVQLSNYRLLEKLPMHNGVLRMQKRHTAQGRSFYNTDRRELRKELLKYLSFCARGTGTD